MAQNLKVCDIDDEVLAVCRKFRFRKEKTTAAVVCKVKDTTIVLEEKYDDISIEELQAELPSSQPRYVFLSYLLKHSDGRISYPLCFIFISPSGCKPEQQMMYAGSKLSLVNACGATKVFEFRSVEEFTEETLKEKLSLFR